MTKEDRGLKTSTSSALWWPRLALWHTVLPEGVAGGHWGKIDILEFYFWLKDIESTDYVCHGTVFIFSQLQIMTPPEPSKVGQIDIFWHFYLKMAKICHQNIKFKYVPMKRFSRNFWHSILSLYLYSEKSFVKIAS